MKSQYIVAIGATILVMALFFSRNTEQKTEIPETETEESAAPAPVPRTVTPPAASPPPAAPAPAPPSRGGIAVEPGLGADLPPVIRQRVSKQLNFMTKCLGLNAARGVGPEAEPTMETLMDQLRPALGESVGQMGDWSQTEIIDADGVRTRVRVDYDYGEGGEATRRLSVYKINAYGMPEIVSLTPDQADNPNEAYISSLVEGKKVTGEESSARMYFGNGEEVIFSMRNGYINGLSVTRGVRSFNCQNLDEERSECSCP